MDTLPRQRPAPFQKKEPAGAPCTQAERVIAKFGSAYRLARLLNKDPAAVYRWTYPKNRGGTGGLVPASAMQHILRVARLEGVLLTPEDLDPRPNC